MSQLVRLEGTLCIAELFCEQDMCWELMNTCRNAGILTFSLSPTRQGPHLLGKLQIGWGTRPIWPMMARRKKVHERENFWHFQLSVKSYQLLKIQLFWSQIFKEEKKGTKNSWTRIEFKLQKFSLQKSSNSVQNKNWDQRWLFHFMLIFKSHLYYYYCTWWKMIFFAF